MASRWLRFIFQLPAISGRRVALRHHVLQRGEAGQGLALEVLQRGAAAGRDVAERGLVEAERAHGRGRVAAADHGEAVDLGDRLGHARGCRPRTAPARTRPSGRSRTRSARRPSASANSGDRLPGRCPGPSRSAGIASAAHRVVLGVGGERGRGHDVDRQHDLAAGPRQQVAAGVDHVVLEQRLADLVALGLEEGEAHAAADEQLVDLGQQRLDDGELVGDLRAAEHHHVRLLGVAR